ncbi:hypothetical protein HDR66_03400 [bacterium]|nr:hypothetical protein [bacterium]
MRDEYGRSLIEVIGIMAISAITMLSTIGMYNMIRHNQMRTIASSQMQQIARDVKLLMEMRGDYTGVSVDYLIKSGALKSDRAPLGGPWSITASADGKTFSINLSELSVGECDYFITATPTWATQVIVNNVPAGDTADNCFSSKTNQISFIVQ